MNTNFYSGQKVLVTGGTGMIGTQLVRMLVENNADVTSVSLDEPVDLPKGVHFKKLDLRLFNNCKDICQNKDIVFHLAGIKGSPKMALEKPASFAVPTITFSMNMMEAARINKVSRYLFTSSIGVYAPSDVFYEDDVWKTFPSPNDRFAGWAKRICELQADAYRIEHKWDKISIARPANVYGPYDNFDPENAMVIPSIIKRAVDGENPLSIWGNGSQIRDFIHSKDVANGMAKLVEKGVNEPVNLGSGQGITIKKIVETIVGNISKNIEIKWDISKTQGDKKRILDVSRAENYGIKSEIDIESGIKDTINWYIQNKNSFKKKYNVFKSSH